MRNLLVRADGGAKIGMGHLVRCRALAQAWCDAGGEVQFASSGESAAETARLAESFGAEWVVVDGYQFEAEYVERLQHAGLRVISIDDYGHAGRYPAELVLNQNLHASAALYSSRGANTGLLLGPRYALLRGEFLRGRRDSDQPAAARRILVTMGGSDPENLTGKVIRALAQVKVPDLEAVVVVGPASPHYAAICKAASKLPFPARVELDPASMPALMAWADVAVSAAGSTCWELAYMGLPALVLVWADNQQAVAESLHQAGSVESLGDHSMISSADIAAALQCLLRSQRIRLSMAEHGRALVDGRGAARVVERILKPLHLCPVEAFSSELSPRPTPVPSFRRNRGDRHTVQRNSAERYSEPIGQVPFDGSDPRAVTAANHSRPINGHAAEHLVQRKHDV